MKFLKALKKSPAVKKWQSLEQTTKVLIVSIAVAVVVMIIVLVAIATKPVPSESPNEVPQPEEVTFRHPLTGKAIDEPYHELPQVFAVMIENSAEAWPLAGLQDAFLVIEAPVEAAIPRFEAFFTVEDATKKIGPVRSARPYYIDWADELDAIYAHVGGSPEALDLIRQYGTIDLNEFYQGEYFYRDERTRYAPHNVYTTIDDLTAAIDELALDVPQGGVWTFKDGAASGEEKSLAIDWTSGTTYDLEWNYDAASNAYVRDQLGAGTFLEGRVDAIADNVVVMASDIEIVDATGRRHIRTVGEGSAYVFQDGRVIVATWKKESRTDRLRFYDEAGNEIVMNAGKTWIEVVESLGQVTISEPEQEGEDAS